MTRRSVRLLGAVVIVSEVLLFATLVASVVTLSTVLTSSLSPSGGMKEPLACEERDGPSGGGIMTCTLLSRNTGVLEVEVTLKIKLLSQAGDLIAEGTDVKKIPVGSAAPLTVALTIPVEAEQKYSLQTVQPKVLMMFECRTLLGLVAIGVTEEVS